MSSIPSAPSSAALKFFAGYYNEIRPHQAHGRPPLAVSKERDKVSPSIEGQITHLTGSQ